MSQASQENFFQKYHALITISGVFLLALVFRILLFHYRFAIGFDEPHYLQLAIAGRVNGLKEMLHPYWPPVFPLFIALFSFVISDVELAGRLVSAILGSALIVPIYYLTKSLFDKKTAVIAMLLVALNPMLAFMNTSILVESTFMTLAITGVVISWKALQERSLIYGLMAGFLWSLSYLTRPDGIGFAIVFSGFVIGKILFDKASGQKRKLLLVWLVVLLSFVVTASPYLNYLRQQIGKWSLSLKWEVGRIDIDEFRSLSSDNRWLPVDMAYHQGDFPKIYELDDFSGQMQVNHYLVMKEKAENFYLALNQHIPNLMSTLLLILMAIGLTKVNYSRERIWLTIYLLAVIAFFWFVVVPLFYVNDRYLIPVLPLCFIWAARGIHVLFSSLVNACDRFSILPKNSSKIKILSAISVATLVCFFSYLPDFGRIISWEKYSPEIWADAIEHKKAGEWLKNHAPSTPVLMAQNHSIDFYAGNYNIRESINIPRNEWKRVFEYARNRGVQYLIINERYCAQWYPELLFLVREENIPSELQVIYKDVDPNTGLKVLIYQITS